MAPADAPVGSIELTGARSVSWHKVASSDAWAETLREILTNPANAGCTICLLSWEDGAWEPGLRFSIPR